MDWRRLFHDHTSLVVDRALLNSRGATARELTAAVRAGAMIRVRRGLYVLPGTDDTVLRAVRMGGRVACVSALVSAGVFVFEKPSTHVQIEPSSPKIGNASGGPLPSGLGHNSGFRAHWRPLIDPTNARPHVVGPIDALVQSVHCQTPEMAIASLDSALHLGYIQPHELGEVFAHLPNRFQRLRPMVDGRCESGVESVFRMLLFTAGIPCEVQVPIRGVGRVDFVVAGRVVVETDGFEFHGPATAARDYARDLTLAALGYIVIRLNYRQVMHEQILVMNAIARVLETLSVHT